MRNLYGVFAPGKRFGQVEGIGQTKWALTWNKRKALRALRREGCGEVRMLRDTPDTGAWDLPTFYVCSTPIAVIGGWNSKA